ncbi:MAG: putative bifunctional diguanylate cyclase/phosphodiesterase [Candidatus Sericytochromatia bacterium]
MIKTFNVLLIEDSEADAAYVSELLEPEQDWRVEQVSSLAAASVALQDENYAAILLDLSLPDSQGLETLLSILKLQGETPVIVISGFDDHQTGMQAVHYGAQDYLIKGSFDGPTLQRSLLHSIERQKLVNSFHHASLHDPLTNLANRNLFLTLVQQSLERRNRNPEQLFAVLFLDLDDFKQVNDRFGHLSGDLLLGEIALRLKTCVRASDVVSRLAGDEFGLLISDLQEPLDVLPVVHRIARVIGQPIQVPGQELEVCTSIGVALSDRSYVSAVELLENADLAMYQAKLNGKATYCIYNDHMEHEKQVLSQLEQNFKQDFRENGLLRMSYRPVISVQDGHVFGLETQLQCQPQSWQQLPFSELCRLAGGSGMLDALNGWICQEVHQQLQRWDKCFDHGWKVFLQLAPEQLKARELHQQLSQLLLAGDLPPGRFYLSLTESMLHHAFSYQDLLPLLKQLHKQGFRLYLEDFGGSYTTLNTLSQIPVDMVKINLEDLAALLPSDAVSDRFLVLAPIIQLAQNLGMQIMVDGIRSDEDMSRLQPLEAVYAQGPYFSDPLSGKEVEVWI